MRPPTSWERKKALRDARAAFAGAACDHIRAWHLYYRPWPGVVEAALAEWGWPINHVAQWREVRYWGRFKKLAKGTEDKMLKITATAPIIQIDGTERWTKYTLSVLGKRMVAFTKEDITDARERFRAGDVMRAQGNAYWNFYADEYTLSLANSAVDLAGAGATRGAIISVDGNIETDPTRDEDDEGAYLRAVVDVPDRKKNSDGEWDDAITPILVIARGEVAKALKALGKCGVHVEGYVDLDPVFADREAGFYVEAISVAKEERGAIADIKPRGLFKQLSAAPKVEAPAVKKPAGAKAGKILDDEIPFNYEWRG